jgi:hypothetical protein
MRAEVWLFSMTFSSKGVMDDRINHETRSLSRTDSRVATTASKFAVARVSGRRYHFGMPPYLGLGVRPPVNSEDIMRRLELLRVEHRDLDTAIAALLDGGSGDQMQVARFKKRKLRLRDEIAMLEDALVPDIIA